MKEVETGDSSGDDGDATFEQLQKKVRVTSTTNNESEISLKSSKCDNEDEANELAAMMWGEQKVLGGTSSASGKNQNDVGSDDEAGPKKKKRAGAVPPRNRGTPQPSEGADEKPDGGFFLRPGSCKKVASEARELEKSEALVLQANQLKCQLQDARSIMQVNLTKVTQMLEKVNTRLTDDATKVLVEIIKKEGSNCRASVVWQSLKDAQAMLSGINDFVEALHDPEAAPATLSARAAALRDLRVQLPSSVNAVVCRREADELVGKGDMEAVFNFLDINQKENYPNGVSSILPPESEIHEDKRDEIVQDFQQSCITHCLHNLLLQDFSLPTADAKLLAKN